MPSDLGWVANLVFLTDLLLRIGLSIRVVARRRSVGVSLAWLAVILFMPFLGAIFYLLFGESRIGERRTKHAMRMQAAPSEWSDALRGMGEAHYDLIEPRFDPILRQAMSVIGIPALPDHHLDLLRGADAFFDRLLEDIANATTIIHAEFYIWHAGGRANEVRDALLAARERGVTVRLLLDAVGSSTFLAGPDTRRLREAGVHIKGALPVRPLRVFLRRPDLRNHRKLVIIDRAVGYAGSQNLVDPREFKQNAGVGHWVDMMARVEGPSVLALAGTFAEDWEVETHESLPEITYIGGEAVGNSTVQVVPSGPGRTPEALHQLLLTIIYTARKELVLTTPYFVPDESMMTALLAAAQRGVEVTIVVPARVDSILVRFASRSNYDDLVAAGARVMLFDGGLLHSKTISVDDSFCVVGSVNLDMRSLWLNFELSLFVYDAGFTADVRELQAQYVASSTAVDLKTWRSRSVVVRFAEDAAKLLSPLL